ncbi:hypothetical protein BH09PSE2_BH09PSE2_02070 [soil metagenome]
MNLRTIIFIGVTLIGAALSGTASAQTDFGQICGPAGGNPAASFCGQIGSLAGGGAPTGLNNVSIGYQSAAGFSLATAIGPGAQAYNVSTTAVGGASNASGVFSAVFGVGASANASSAVAIGVYSNATGVNSVALGGLSNDGGRTNVISVGSSTFTRQIINVGAGTVGATSTDAVNGSQLFAVQQLATQAAVGANAVQYDNVAHTSVTLNSGGDSAQLRNVAAGTATTDAANVAQLTAAFNSAVATAQGYTDQRVTTFSTQVSGLSSQVAGLSDRLAGVAKDADAGTAAAIAGANIPQAVASGRTTVGGAVGSWNGQAAFALGASHMFEGGKFALRGSANFDSRGSTGGGVGFGVSF